MRTVYIYEVLCRSIHHFHQPFLWANDFAYSESSLNWYIHKKRIKFLLDQIFLEPHSRSRSFRLELLVQFPESHLTNISSEEVYNLWCRSTSLKIELRSCSYRLELGNQATQSLLHLPILNMLEFLTMFIGQINNECKSKGIKWFVIHDFTVERPVLTIVRTSFLNISELCVSCKWYALASIDYRSLCPVPFRRN